MVLCTTKHKKLFMCSFKPMFIFKISVEVLNNIAKELDFNGNKCEILNKYFEYENKQRKIIENENDLQYKDYRDIK